MRAEKLLLAANPLDQPGHYSDVPVALFAALLTLAHEDPETAQTSYQTSSCDVRNAQ